MRTVHLLDNLIIIPFADYQAAVHGAVIQQSLHQIGMKGAENIAGSEMNPERILFCLRNHLLPVKLRKLIALLKEFVPALN